MQTIIQDKRPMNTGIHEQETKSIAQGAGLVFIGRIIAGSVQYLYVLIVAQMLGIADFGLWMLSLAVINLAGVISRLGLDIGVVRFIAIHNGLNNKSGVKGTIIQSLAISFIISVLLGITLFLFAQPLCTTFFGKPQLAQLVKLLSFSLPFFSVMTVALSATRGFQVMKYTVYGQDIFYPLCNTAFASVLLMAGYKTYGVAAGYIAAVFLASLFSLWLLLKAFPSHKEVKASYSTELFGFSIPLMLTILLHSIVIWTDTLMLGRFRLPEDVGIYNVCAKTAVLTGTILVSFNTIFTPMASDLYKQNQLKKLGDMFQLITRWVYSISLPVFLLILLLSEEILGIFGHEYMAGKYALIILAFAQLIFAGTGSTAVVLAMSGRQYIVMFNTIGICMANIVLNYFLIRPYGIAGAAIATGFSLIASNVIMLFCAYYLLKIQPYNRKFLKVTLMGTVAFGVTFLAGSLMRDAGGILKLAILIPLYLAFYTGMSVKWAWYEEDWFIVNMLKAKLKAGS